MRKTIAVFLLVFLCLALFSADKTDSLKTVFSKAKTKEQKISAGLLWINEIKKKSPENAIENYEALLKNPEFNEISGLEIRVKQELAIQHNLLGNDSKAVQILLDLLEKTNTPDLKKYQKKIFTDLGLVYYYQQDYDKSLDYFKKSYRAKLSDGDSSDIGGSLVNIGSIYSKAQVFDSAATYLNAALSIFKLQKDSLKIAQTLNNLGNLYNRQSGNDQKAKYYFENALTIYKKIEDKRNEGISLANLGIINTQSGNFKEGIAQLQSALSIAEGKSFPALKRHSLSGLKEAYESQSRFDSAFYFQSELHAFQDSLNIQEQQKQIEELEAKYKFKEQQQAIHIKDLKIKQLAFLFGFFVILAFALALIAWYFRQKKKNKEALEAAKARFYSNIAHEFRTPVSLITTPLQELMQSTGDEKIRSKLSLAHKNALQILNLINQLLDIAKLENDKLPVVESYGDLVDFINQCIENNQSLAGEKGIEIKKHFADAELYCYFDADKMEKVIQNILSNAIKFSPNNSVINISQKCIELNGIRFLKLSIKDNGLGIESHEQENIFKRFYRTENSEKQQISGTGIGLALAREFMELQGGSIELKSESGKGSTFDILLPIKAENDSTEMEQSPFKIKSTDTLEVLIVEDNADLRNYVIGLLEAKSIKCSWAENGQKGFEMDKMQVPDLIISDVLMPMMNGIELSNKIKQDPATEHIPIILLTAKSAIESRLEGLEAGVFAYLTKPFHVNELMQYIQNFISIKEKIERKYADAATEKEEKDAANYLLNNPHPFIQQIREVVEENLEESEFSIEALSAQLALSRTQVHRKVKALTGLSTSQLVRNIRLEKAYEMLKSHQGNVSEVAYKSGFSSPSYFSKSFAAYFGHPPAKMQ